MHRLVISFILFLAAPGLLAVELPAPGELRKEMGVSGHYVAVVEPHQSDVLDPTHVTYLAVRANEVLDHLFGAEWQSPDNDIVFSATDGYQYAANAERFTRYKGYLAYARADAGPFAFADGKGQKTELGPYYLIWDNIDDPELIRQRAYGWPYEVVRVEVRPVSAYAPLLPENATRQARDGFALFKQYCLVCHQIANIGGQKLPTDLRQSLCSREDAELRSLIDNPGQALHKGGMPALDPQLQGEGRKQTIDLIMAYLRTLQPQGRSCQQESVRSSADK